MSFFSGPKFDETQCKTNLKLSITRLNLQKTKKENYLKNLKREIAELLKVGKVESARIKVESVIREDFIIEAYEILELFCQLILSRLGTIQVSKECPADLKEAVCTVIYAAPRAEVKELQVIRQQLFYKFGKEFANDAIMNKDNCVNARVIHKLAVQTPENYMIYNYLNEIAKAHGVDWQSEVPAPEPTQPAPKKELPSTSALQFPDVPSSKGTVSSTPKGFDLQFPDPPKNVSNPLPPSTTTSMTPQFPSVPEPDIPTFNPNDLPGLNFPTPPPVINSNSNLNFPSVPTQNGTTTTTTPDFPTPPSFSSAYTTPSNKTTMNFDDLFPSPPSNGNGNGNGPSSSDSNVPDFDELTARFEKLKKRDL